MNAGNAIYTLLNAASAVTAIVGTGSNCRVYPLHVAQGKVMPYIAYRCTLDQPNPSKDSASTLDKYRVEVMCFYKADQQANGPYTKVNTLADAVRSALDKCAAGTYSGINLRECNYRTQRDEWIQDAQTEGAVAIMQEYTMWIQN
jgi:hypothetical protein